MGKRERENCRVFGVVRAVAYGDIGLRLGKSVRTLTLALVSGLASSCVRPGP